MKSIRPALIQYVEEEIIPRYATFDRAHREDHVRMVIRQALELADRLGADAELLYAAAAFHDTGLVEGRERHHLVSGDIIRADARLPEWFTPEQIALIAEAAEDHRASSDHEPRSVYGIILAEADRFIDPETIVLRTIQFSLAHYPDYDREQHYERTITHLKEKYGEGGYLRLWVPDSPNAQRLNTLRQLIADEARLRPLFDKLFTQETTPAS